MEWDVLAQPIPVDTFGGDLPPLSGRGGIYVRRACPDHAYEPLPPQVLLVSADGTRWQVLEDVGDGYLAESREGEVAVAFRVRSARTELLMDGIPDAELIDSFIEAVAA